MTTMKFLLVCLAMMRVINANSLSLRVSPVGYNKSSLISSGAFTGRGTSSISSKMPPNSSIPDDTSPSSCCFVVQDTIDVRYWADSYTQITTISTYITSIITFATQYIDTLIATNVSTVVEIVSHTSYRVSSVSPSYPNTYNKAPGPSLTQIALTSSYDTAFGATITPPTQFYVFPSVNIINVPAVTDKSGRLMCATTSTYGIECSSAVPLESNSTTATVRNDTQDAGPTNALQITGINSNAQMYFSNGPRTDSANVSSEFDKTQISFSKPFVYAPLSDKFPSTVVNENLGYVPQSLIDWMAQQPDYVSKYPGIASCLPGGPSLDFYFHFCDPGIVLSIAYEHIERDLTISSAVTIAGRGCFHPGACPTATAPGATAFVATPVVTHEAQSQDTIPSAEPKNPLRPQAPQAPKQILPGAVEKSSSAPTTPPRNQAANAPPRPPSNAFSPSPPDTAILPSSTPTDSSENPSVNSPKHNDEADSPPDNLAKPPTKFPALAAVLATAFGINPDSPSKIEDVKPSPGPTPTLSYSISIAPSALAVVINGVVSIPPAKNPGQSGLAASIPIAVGSERLTQNAASQYVVAGQTLTPGAPPINIQGTQVSLAPSANAIVIAGSTIILSSTSRAPAFTVGSEIVTANSASQYVLNGQTLTPGGSAVTVSGTRVSLASSGSHVVIGSSTIGLTPTITHPPPPPLTFGGQTFTANSKSEYTINGQKLIPGFPAITVSGTPISLAPAATQVVIGSNTKDLAPATTLPPLTFGSHVFTANSKSEYIINGQTLIPGGPAVTVSGTRLSLAPSATQFMIGSSTINIDSAFTPPPLTFNSQTYTADAAGAYIIGSQTLTPGGAAITVSGTRLSLAPSGTQIVIGSSTIPLSFSPSRTFPILTIASQTYTANAAGAYVIAGQTLTPGGSAITVSGTRISLAPSDTQLVIGTSTIPLSPSPTLPALTIASHTYTANADGAYVIAGQTLTPGGSAITVSGTRISLAPSDTQLVIGTSTIPLLPSPTLPVLTIASQTYTANADGAYVIAGQTLIPGGSGIVVPGSLLRGAEASASVHEIGVSRSGVSSSIPGTQQTSDVPVNGDGTSTLKAASTASTGSPISTGSGCRVSMHSLSEMWELILGLFILTVIVL